MILLKMLAAFLIGCVMGLIARKRPVIAAVLLVALFAADASAEIPPRYRLGDRLLTAEGSVIEITKVSPEPKGPPSYEFIWTESPFLKIDSSESLVDWFASSATYVPSGKPMPKFTPAKPKYDYIVNGVEVQMYLDGKGPPPLWQWT